jgi:hypothetical protein
LAENKSPAFFFHFSSRMAQLIDGKAIAAAIREEIKVFLTCIGNDKFSTSCYRKKLQR